MLTKMYLMRLNGITIVFKELPTIKKALFYGFGDIKNDTPEEHFQKYLSSYAFEMDRLDNVCQVGGNFVSLKTDYGNKYDATIYIEVVWLID